MASSGSSIEQRKEVARVASVLFGAPVATEDVIGETLERTTREPDLTNPSFRNDLARRVKEHSEKASLTDYSTVIADPLSRWIENTFGITTEAGTQRLIRATPRPVGGDHGAALDLARLTDVDADTCRHRIEEHLLVGSQVRHPETGFPVFAFRLHQFISRGETVYASIERETNRYLTLHPQKFVPGERSKLLVPLVFCRECGQEYYTVRRIDEGAGVRLEPRTLQDRAEDGEGDVGYLYINSERPWVFQPEELPDDWLEPGDPPRVKYHLRTAVPREMRVLPDGRTGEAGVVAHYIGSPFRFCLNCGVAYGGRARADFAKLATLGSEGRSTATTVLSLSAVRHLREETGKSAREASTHE